ncbi:hypothetical protein A5784_20480 [Mycobacterium sp. 852013-50091_SCH5140682]|nr:hypothetical protein A5784_20480 [Mycobacterium sp. 852013-50091_SCH5140682]
MAVVGVVVIYRGAFRPWMYTWGAGKEEVAAELPGDELVEADAPRTTRAVTIDAPVRTIWSWLVQIGEGRGGFYSYAFLERAVGARIHNAHRIHPEWQDLHVGDTIWLARRYGGDARQVVARIEPESDLVLMSPADFERVQQGEKASGVWSFHVRRRNGWARLIVRGSGGFVGRPWFDIAHFIMEHAMMRGLRKRAERTARAEYEHYGELRSAQSDGMATVTPIP